MLQFVLRCGYGLALTKTYALILLCEELLQKTSEKISPFLYGSFVLRHYNSYMTLQLAVHST